MDRTTGKCKHKRQRLRKICDELAGLGGKKKELR